MKIRKFVAVLATAGLAFWVPSVVPVQGFFWRLRLQAGHSRISDDRHGLCGPVDHSLSGRPTRRRGRRWR